jgi:hypothetical protein
MTDDEKKEKMCNCNHLFTIIKGGIRPDSNIRRHNHISPFPIIECIKCGLTNKNVILDRTRVGMFSSKVSIETEMFEKFANSSNFKGIFFLNYLSKYNIGTDNPHLLYQIAEKVNFSLNADVPESYPMILDTMKTLLNIAKENNLNLNNINDLYKAAEIYESGISYEKVIK